MPTILIVDDEFSMREFLTILLEKEGFSAIVAEDGESALKELRHHQIDLIISDIRMPGMGGLKLLEKVKEIDPSIPVVMITAYASPEDAVNAMKNGESAIRNMKEEWQQHIPDMECWVGAPLKEIFNIRANGFFTIVKKCE